MANKAVIESLRAQIDAVESGCDHVVGGGRKTADEPHREETGTSGALNKIIALVNASDKSERSIRERLARSDYPQEEVDRAVEDAKRYGFIDDARFAQVLIRSRLSQLRGSAGIERELVENGIDPGEVDGWPFDFPVSHEEELDRALGLLDRKPPRSKNARDGAYRRLVQKGYPSSVASSAARIWSER